MSSAATKACVETRCPPNFPGGHSVQETRRGSQSARHPAGSEAVVEGFEPPLAFTPNIISSDAPSAARTHHQL